MTKSTVIRGIQTTDFWVVMLVLSGVDPGVALVIMSGGVPNAEQIEAVIASLHGQAWQVLAIKAALAGLYVWVRLKLKENGIELEREKIRIARTEQ